MAEPAPTKRVAVIGSSGYIGSYLVERMRAEQQDVVGIDLRPCVTTDVVARGRDADLAGFDVVVFLGGLTGRASCAKETWGNIYSENVEEVMEVGRKLGEGQLLLYASTAGLLEGAVEGAVGEGWEVKEALLDSYTLSMHEREKRVKELGCHTVGMRFGTVIGVSKGQRRDLVHIAMLRSAYMNGEIEVQYPGCHRAILWMKDLYAMVTALVHGSAPGRQMHRVYNMCSFNTTVGAIAECISAKTGIAYRVTDGREGGGEKGFMMDSSAFLMDHRWLRVCPGNEVVVEDLKEHIGEICIDTDGYTQACRVCGLDWGLVEVLDLGYQPLANNFVSAPCAQNEYPLCLMRCRACNHTQLSYTVRPEVMFRNYQYNSGTSWTLRDYFRQLAEECTEDCCGKAGKVLELACNDGSQLDEFKKLGWETYGVDPAVNLARLGAERGHHIECGFWGKDVFVGMPTGEDLDIIVAQNVCAHVPDPVAFLGACAEAMGKKTILYIQTSQCNMFKNGEFDTIYHEHLSFFTISSMMEAAERVGLGIVDISKKDIHGTSYLFKMMRGVPHSQQALGEFDKEREAGLYEDAFYEGYREKIEGIKHWVEEKMAWCKDNGVRVVAYGAAAKGMTMLNYFRIKDISYIVDDATMKHNKYTPGTNIRVLPVEDLAEEDEPICVLVLAWNFLGEIMKKVWTLRPPLQKKTYIMQVFPQQDLFKLCINPDDLL